MEIWLRPNRRAAILGMIPLVIFGGVALVVALGWFGSTPSAQWRIAAGTAALFAGIFLVGLTLQLRVARVGYNSGRVYINLRGGGPIATPLESVEAFLMGQSPARAPGPASSRGQAATLIVRLAENASEWANREVNPRLGKWRDGYITISGVWCEPLSVDLVKRLNRRLSEVKRELASATPNL